MPWKKAGFELETSDRDVTPEESMYPGWGYEFPVCSDAARPGRRHPRALPPGKRSSPIPVKIDGLPGYGSGDGIGNQTVVPAAPTPSRLELVRRRPQNRQRSVPVASGLEACRINRSSSQSILHCPSYLTILTRFRMSQ